VVQVDASGSGGLVDAGVACWVGISGALGAREERGMSAWQFAVMKPALSSPSIEAFSALSNRGRNGIPCVQPFFGLQPTPHYLCNNALQQNPRKAGSWL
jgi:hypothetical protein